VIEDRFLRSCGTTPRPFSLLANSSTEFLRPGRRSPLSVRATTYQGLCPHRDITSARPPLARVPKSPLGSVHRRSQPLDGLLRVELAGLFHPAAASRAFPVQGFRRSAQPPSLVERSCPLAVGARSAHRPMNRNRLPQTRHPDFEAFLHAESRVEGSAVRPHPRPLPSSGLLLLQVLLGPPRPVLQTRTLVTFSARSYDDASVGADPHGSPPARSQTEAWCSRLRDHRPARAFRAFLDPAVEPRCRRANRPPTPGSEELRACCLPAGYTMTP
jgi:hypothetical protein